MNLRIWHLYINYLLLLYAKIISILAILIFKIDKLENMARFADAHNIPNEQISQEECLEKIISKFESFEISKSMPYFLEIKSYRLYEHCGHKKDVKNGDRTGKEYEKFLNKDIVSKWIEENKSINGKTSNYTYKKSVDICNKLAELLNLKMYDTILS